MSANKPDFLEYIRERVLLADGALGSYLYAKGIELGKNIERLNLADPDLVYSVHEEYIRAGSRLIETNTFGANRLKLENAGLEDKARQINLAGAELAVRAGSGEVYVAGSVGPSGADFPLGETEGPEREAVEAAFKEQIEALLEGGVDLLILETFSHLDELLLALKVARRLAGKMPIVANMVYPKQGCTAAGLDALECGRAALAAGADVVGSNCGRGARAMLTAMERLAALGEEVPLAAFPNAGFPEIVNHRLIYPAEPPYMAQLVREMVKTGARLVGGCCGTTPAHIQEFGKHLRLKRRPLTQVASDKQATGPDSQAPTAAKAGSLLKRLPTDKLPVLVEVDPPTHLDISGVLGGAKELAAAGADAITLGENPLAVLRADNISLAHKIRSEVGIATVAHVTCRDRNALGLQSQIMGAHLLEIDSILAVTGDPATTGDQPAATGVFDVQSFGLIRMLNQFNQGRNPAGKAMKGQCDFSIGAAFSYRPNNPDLQIRRLERKAALGAVYAMTQPFFSAGAVEDMLERTRHLEMLIFPGIFPLISARNAEFLHHEVPGINIPEDLRRKLGRYEAVEDQRRVADEFTRELIAEICPIIDGLYLISPLNKWEVTAELTREVRQAGWKGSGRLAALVQ
ncbi:bifunctional homocysteine S-methyltransferase/methylenetetrahydrofolate reductase [Desulfurivibrio alkaliphilus]|uniref:Homocysteine S-methyltransferase n=1 Tax=Desulfurivibrio alkaliphilus (strain DSM 19089 / UNIQEM U267 / AHT2) TaxID=589865 RepID=D6Z0B2_DESAT|nr:bifunctional homocysteine S-methyltransferase/methylenetetrahydrofolate reductase [Desulfurivibrio alkaliphilus]ADH87145.1 homocysteine S-methyltransferase [Desulfurivibrio alkaliphilus AHT 2]